MLRPFLHRLQTPGVFPTAWLSALLALFATGCASTRHLSDAEDFYRTGQYQVAAQVVSDAMPTEECKQERPKHVLDSLYLGSSEFMAGNFTAAESAFGHAIRGMDEQDKRTFNLGNDYQGTSYDAIMAGTYRALSLWMNGQIDQARVAFRQTAETQEHASDRNARLIQRMQRQEQSQLRDSSNPEDVSATVRNTMRNGANAQTLALFQKDVNEWGSYDSFENPASHFLDAVFALANREGPSDLEHGSFASRKALAMTPSIPAKNLFDLIEALADRRVPSSELDDVLIVVFENGLGPTLIEKRFDLLIPVDNQYYYVGMALPQLLKRPEAYAGLVLTDGDKILGSTRRICDFNRLVSTSYKQALPRLIAAEVLRCSLMVAVQAVANEAAKEEYGEDTAVFVSLAGSLLAQSTAKADTRMWKLLPNNYQASLSRKPTSGWLSIAPSGNGRPIAQVAIPKKGLSVVYVKIPAPGLPPLCRLLGPRKASFQ